MADSHDLAPQPIAVSPPPTVYASHSALTFNPSEFLVSLGHSRVIVQSNDGNLTPNQIYEWLITVALSPTAAKMLAAGLSAGVAAYEGHFGTIPMVPDFKVEIDKKQK